MMACLLKVWSSLGTSDPNLDLPGARNGSTALQDNTALSSIDDVCRMYSAMRTVGASITRSHSHDEASARVLSLARIIYDGTTASQRYAMLSLYEVRGFHSTISMLVFSSAVNLS